MIKAEFSASLLQSSVSHDPSEIILECWFIINVRNISAAYLFIFEQKKQTTKNLNLFKIEFCINICSFLK